MRTVHTDTNKHACHWIGCNSIALLSKAFIPRLFCSLVHGDCAQTHSFRSSLFVWFCSFSPFLSRLLSLNRIFASFLCSFFMPIPILRRIGRRQLRWCLFVSFRGFFLPLFCPKPYYNIKPTLNMQESISFATLPSFSSLYTLIGVSCCRSLVFCHSFYFCVDRAREREESVQNVKWLETGILFGWISHSKLRQYGIEVWVCKLYFCGKYFRLFVCKQHKTQRKCIWHRNTCGIWLVKRHFSRTVEWIRYIFLRDLFCSTHLHS